MDEEARQLREPSLVDALIPLVTLAVLIGGSLLLFGLDALDGPIQVALVLCAMVAALIALKNGHAWEEVQNAGQGSLASVTSAIFILLAVGALIGTWNLSGTIPTLVYYGIQVLSPGWYYAAAALICGIVALSIGSSWTTAGTIGVGLVGIARCSASPRDHRGRRDLGRLPGRQALTAVGDDGPRLADGQGRRLRPHQAAGVDVGAGVRCRVGRVPRARPGRTGTDDTVVDDIELDRAARRLPDHAPEPAAPRAARRTVDPQGAGLAGPDRRRAVRRACWRRSPSPTSSRRSSRHGGDVVVESIKARVAGHGHRLPDGARVSPRSTASCPAAAWTACCPRSG